MAWGEFLCSAAKCNIEHPSDLNKFQIGLVVSTMHMIGLEMIWVKNIWTNDAKMQILKKIYILELLG